VHSEAPNNGLLLGPRGKDVVVVVVVVVGSSIIIVIVIIEVDDTKVLLWGILLTLVVE